MTKTVKPDPKLMFEVSVDSLKSHVDSDSFDVTCQFANKFTVRLKDPVEKISSNTFKCKNQNIYTQRRIVRQKKQSGRTIFSTNDLDQLIHDMQQFPLEISLSSRQCLDNSVGTILIAWSQVFINYLKKLKMQLEPPPAIISHEYNVFDQSTSKLMAAIKLNMRMNSLKETKAQRRKHFTFTKASSVSTDSRKYPYYNSKSKQTKSTKKHSVVPKDKGNKEDDNVDSIEIDKVSIGSTIPQSRLSITVFPSRSDTYSSSVSSKLMLPLKSRSVYSLKGKKRLQAVRHPFGDRRGPFGNQVYCVGYVTVDDKKPTASKKVESGVDDSTVYKFKICDQKCLNKAYSHHSEIDLPNESQRNVLVKKCTDVRCEERQHYHVPEHQDPKILIDMKSMIDPCCKNVKVEEVHGEVKLHMDSQPCSCSCACSFGFVKKTTYCTVCGGYESAGEDFSVGKLPFDLPYPCPVYHNMIDKNKLKTVSSFGSDSKKNEMGQKSRGAKSEKRIFEKLGGMTQPISGQSIGAGPKSKTGALTADSVSGKVTIEAEKDRKKKVSEKLFYYDYKAPHIGHSKCALPCDGFINPVPKKMGWLWNTDILGLKFRPNWKPGATHKHVVRLLKIAKNPGEVITGRRKKRETRKTKKPIKRPLITVHKKDGEFTITMETMKTYSKPRTLNQVPYEDKPPLSYTIGKTEEEMRLRQRKKIREKRRLERAQRMFIQSTFQNLCKDICYKTYQQALGILSDNEKPDCVCFPALPGPNSANLDVSCSCSEDSLISSSDSDEWIIEFTPPNCMYDPKYKVKKVPKSESFAQYSTTDYKVIKYDRFGKEVPKFFKGPDGKQYSSELGGWRDAKGKWHEINVDGFIGPDGRWCPNIFIGPNGETVDVENGQFQTSNNQTYEVGVHGYVDANGKWRFYNTPRDGTRDKFNRNIKVEIPAKPGDKNIKVSGGAGDKNTKNGGSGDKNTKGGAAGDKTDNQIEHKPSETFSCFGDASAKYLSQLGIVGHGHDRKLLLSTLKDMIAKGKPVKIPEYPTVPRVPGSVPRRNLAAESRKRYLERIQCKHATPSEKGVIAVDGLGNKTYFRIKECQNTRPQQRVAGLTSQGISLSSFHVPCFTSFINAEYMRQQQCMRIIELAQQCKNTATQVN